jgi:hypothetical protein
MAAVFQQILNHLSQVGIVFNDEYGPFCIGHRVLSWVVGQGARFARANQRERGKSRQSPVA